MSVYPECIRCGMCCLIEPCCFGKLDENSVCIYLLINKDNTATCLNTAARIEYSGSGCIFMRPENDWLYHEHMEFYSIDKRKQELSKHIGVN